MEIRLKMGTDHSDIDPCSRERRKYQSRGVWLNRSILKQRGHKWLLGGKLRGCSRHCPGFTLMPKRRQSVGSQGAAGSQVKRQGERITSSKMLRVFT